MAFAFHAEWMPEGSVWYSWGAPKGSKPTTSVEIPKGRTPPLWLLARQGSIGSSADDAHGGVPRV
eukprot:scaffold206237_cov13-Tisochrysis_lutea.AAC.1